MIPQLKDADVEKSLTKGKTIWYFEHLTDTEQCFTHTVRRYFPVANLTRTRQGPPTGRPRVLRIEVQLQLLKEALAK